MRLRKAYAVAISAVVLGLQFWVIVPPRGYNAWYWPFVDYPMYSAPRYAGDQFRYHELRALPCDTAAPPLVVDYKRLRVTKFRFYALLAHSSRIVRAELTTDTSDTTLALLRRLVGDRVGGAYCTVELLERRFTIPKSGPVEREPPWRRVYAWPLDAGDTLQPASENP